jgi:hypothetical protein
MSAGSVTTQLVKKLAATGATRLAYSNKKEPWNAGSRLRATSPGAAVLSGVNMYGMGDRTTARKGRVLIISTDANSDGATRKAYTIPADALALGPITLPVTASVATAAAYLDCMIGIAPNVNEIQNAVFGERIAYGGSLASAGQWKVDDTDGFSFYTATTHGQVIVIFVPLAADIAAVSGTMVAGCEQEIASYDFLCATTTAVTLTIAPRLCG